MAAETNFKLTYATMFNPPKELHDRYEQALTSIKANLGREFTMIIDGKERFAAEKFENRSPINTNWVLGIFQKGTAQDAQDAITAAGKAFPLWSRMPWQERAKLLRKTAEIIDRRIFEIGAAVSLEVGKNRMEALGDVAETADLIRYSCDQMEANNGYVVEMGRDPLAGYSAVNTSVLRPHGVWLVISPFNFPAALTGGPAGAALVTGNTLIMKPSSDTPWAARFIAECMLEAGIPDGVFNYVTGPGGTIGQALVESPQIAGVTFTGSYNVGMKIYRDFANAATIRPAILEMGGKNPAIVSRNADLEDAALGITRSAFGLQGQKCSACSRVFVEEPVYDALIARLVELTKGLVIGDPTEREVYLGPVINRNAYRDFQNFAEDLNQHSRILTGGRVLTEGDFSKGYFCEPTLAVNLPLDHPLWKTEMFTPITTIARISSLDEGMRLANDIGYGLTAGFYGDPQEAAWFFDHIEAGVTYANRPQGATTGAWPGFQPFGGWKGSGATGKNAGGLYYLPLFMREQIHTLIRRGSK